MIDIGSPQFMYMAEAEGLTDVVNTRTAKINAAIKSIRANYDEISEDEIMDELKAQGIYAIDEKEWDQILLGIQ